jgi:hypothetical protein
MTKERSMIAFRVHLKKKQSASGAGILEPVREWLRSLERAVLQVQLRRYSPSWSDSLDGVNVRLGGKRDRKEAIPRRSYEVDLFSDALDTRLDCFFHRIKRGMSVALVVSVSLFSFSMLSVKKGEASEQAHNPLIEKQMPQGAQSAGPVRSLPDGRPVLLATDCFRVLGECCPRELKPTLDQKGKRVLIGAYHDNTPGIDHVNVPSHDNTPWLNHNNMVTPHSNTPWSNHINNQYPHTNIVPGDFIY